jgi:hypothetical protein
MELLSDCPECGKQLSHSRKYCACGWRIAILNEKNVIDRNCQYQTSHGPCKESGTISPGKMDGKWFCRHHWYVAVQEKFKY